LSSTSFRFGFSWSFADRTKWLAVYFSWYPKRCSIPDSNIGILYATKDYRQLMLPLILSSAVQRIYDILQPVCVDILNSDTSLHLLSSSQCVLKQQWDLVHPCFIILQTYATVSLLRCSCPDNFHIRCSLPE
jgi:hypothetical protein